MYRLYECVQPNPSGPNLSDRMESYRNSMFRLAGSSPSTRKIGTVVNTSPVATSTYIPGPAVADAVGLVPPPVSQPRSFFLSGAVGLGSGSSYAKSGYS